eukprot:GHVT01078517.1.p2 GENE.GHVT01078517.1~~GHVT01078517.1.p2  ORF type:complete len:128 (-),score=10.87 GHVT01078517.1:839-1222(-)
MLLRAVTQIADGQMLRHFLVSLNRLKKQPPKQQYVYVHTNNHHNTRLSQIVCQPPSRLHRHHKVCGHTEGGKHLQYSSAVTRHGLQFLNVGKCKKNRISASKLEFKNNLLERPSCRLRRETTGRLTN